MAAGKKQGKFFTPPQPTCPSSLLFLPPCRRETTQALVFRLRPDVACQVSAAGHRHCGTLVSTYCLLLSVSLMHARTLPTGIVTLVRSLTRAHINLHLNRTS